MAVDKTEQLKKQLLESMSKSLGVISTACKQVGISRTTYYEYLKDPEFKKAVSEIEAEAVDFAESKLFELINGIQLMSKDGPYQVPPCKTSIIFYLKTKGKHRGYVERVEQVTEITDETVKKLSVEFVNGKK